MSPLHKQNDEVPKPGDVTYFGKSDYRNRGQKFGIKREDRTRHTYVIGKTGMGKTTLLENMAVQDIQNGNGLTFIDPHGEVADNLLDYVPEDRIEDVMYFAPFDLENPISFNVMEDVGDDKRHLVADGLLSAFKKIWVDMWSGRMEYLLNNALLALLEYPDATILGVNRMFADAAYRKRVVANITDVSVKSFWEEEYANYDESFARQAASAIQNKVGQFVSNPQVRNIVGQVNSSFDTRQMMDDKKILLINLSKGQVGEDNARLIGSMLITKMYLAAMSRADTGGANGGLANLPQHYFYVDEFQSFANESFAGILSEARKYKLNLTMAHQYIEQMTEDVRNAVFGNVGTMITFRVGAFDAEVLEKEFAPEFEAEDLVNLGFAQIYLKLMINGVSSKPFSARTLPPIEPENESHREEIIAYSREQYGRPRTQVEKEIDKWHDSTYGIIDDEKAAAIAKKQEEELGPDPFGDASETVDKFALVEAYEVGQVISGPIAGIADFGIFVQVEPGLEGLVHVSELADKKVENPADIYEEGEEVTAQVIEKDGDKISLSIKQLDEEEVSTPEAPKPPTPEDTDEEKKETDDNKKDTAPVQPAEDSKDFFASDSEQVEKKPVSSDSDDQPQREDEIKQQSDEPTDSDDDSKPAKKQADESASPDTSDDTAGKQTTASLKEDAKQSKGKADKGPSTANKSKLQAALANVGKNTSGENEGSQEELAETSRQKKDAESKKDLHTKKDTSSSQKAENRAPKAAQQEGGGEEIPEDELRDMLAVDEDNEE